MWVEYIAIPPLLRFAEELQSTQCNNSTWKTVRVSPYSSLQSEFVLFFLVNWRVFLGATLALQSSYGFRRTSWRRRVPRSTTDFDVLNPHWRSFLADGQRANRRKETVRVGLAEEGWSWWNRLRGVRRWETIRNDKETDFFTWADGDSAKVISCERDPVHTDIAASRIGIVEAVVDIKQIARLIQALTL